MSLEKRTRGVRYGVRMLWKRCISYRKREWSLSDYPVVVREQKDVPANSRYFARILGWNIDGLGETPEDALREMEHWYDTRKTALQSEGKPIPRPGTKVPVQFASQDRAKAQDDLLQDFIHRVLDLKWAFISDESTLFHFQPDGKTDPLVARIMEVYGVDVSDVVDGNVATILERIAAARNRR
ncbi:MAG TPA: hypothetical protein VKB38_13455 [Terracidiphilus sp.]|nr:hypothetical protein [Terracidiphilus sp.]